MRVVERARRRTARADPAADSGTLYYLVLLDTAASIEEPAMKDFDYFLENLTVE